MKTIVNVHIRFQDAANIVYCDKFRSLRLLSNGTTITLEKVIYPADALLMEGAAISANYIHLRSENNVRALWVFGEYCF